MNIEVNHATLAGHTFEHELQCAADAGMLGSIDANRGDAQNGDLLAEPEIITRGFIYVKDSEELLQDLRNLTMSTAEAYRGKRGRDLNELKGAIRSAVSNYLFKATKRSPMVLPVITKL